MSLTGFEQNTVYGDFVTYRLLEGTPTIRRDYFSINGMVKAFTLPDSGKFTNSTRPAGISCFIPMYPLDEQCLDEGASPCFVSKSNLPDHWGLVFTHVMTLPLAKGQTKAFHFHLFPTVSMSEEMFHDVLKTNITTDIPQWLPCNCFVEGEEKWTKELLKDSDLDGFDDTRVRTLAYYVARWYADNNADNNADSVDKCYLGDIYFWLVEQKPSLESVYENVRYHFIMYYLDTFQAESGDCMGAADLQDVRLELESLDSFGLQ